MHNYSLKQCVGKVGKARNSSIELLRIFTMIGIVAHHYVINSEIYHAILDTSPTHIASLYALVFGGWGKIGINIFLIISGYFMCRQTPDFYSHIRLFLEIEFYNVVFMIIFSLTGYYSYGIKDIIKSFIPFYYLGMEFVPTYLVFWFYIPFINMFIDRLCEDSHRKLVIMLLLTDTVFQTLIKLPDAFTYCGWFFTVYMLASYIRFAWDGDYKIKFIKRDLLSDRHFWFICMICTMFFSVFSILAGAFVYDKTGINIIWHFVADSNKLLSIVTAVSIFCFFNSKVYFSKWINYIAKSVFGVLCIHANSNAMRKWLWGDIFHSIEQYRFGFMHPVLFVIQSIVTVLSIFIVCTVIDIIRREMLEKTLMSLIHRVCINKKK